MARYRIELEVEVPDEVTDDEVYDWARFNLGENGRLAAANPLIRHPLEAIFSSVQIERESNESLHVLWVTGVYLVDLSHSAPPPPVGATKKPTARSPGPPWATTAGGRA